MLLGSKQKSIAKFLAIAAIFSVTLRAMADDHDDDYKEHSQKNHRLISDLASTFNISFESCRVNIRKMGLPLWIH